MTVPTQLELLKSTFSNLPVLPSDLTEAVIDSRTQQLFFPGNKTSGRLQVITGTLPIAQDAPSWTWQGGDPSLLAEDVTIDNSDQERLFWAGLLLGIAGAAAVALLSEFISMWSSEPKRQAA
jgi:hypothetical protein